jgi:hypothetical protein
VWCNQAISSGQPAGVSPVRGDARVLGSWFPACGEILASKRNDEVLIFWGASKRPVRSMKRNLQRRHKSPARAGTKRKPSPWFMVEGHGRYLGTWSGYLRILRRKGCGTVGGVVLGTGESLLGPILGEWEACLLITGGSGRWWMVERQSEGVVRAWKSSGQHNPA